MWENDILPRIAYVGPTPFPDGGAAARRILGNALSMRDAGFEVLIGAGQLPTDGAFVPNVFQGFAVYPTGERAYESFPTLLKHLMYVFSGKRTLHWLDSLTPKPKAVILYSGYSPFLMRLGPWCKKHGIPLVFDAVEWYEPNGMPGGPYSPYRWNIELAMRYLSPRTGCTIVISRYLENYYSLRGCETFRVPPTLDTMTVTPNLAHQSNGLLRIGYTGTPGKKDLLDNVLEGILSLDPHGKRLRFAVAGIKQEEVLAYPSLRRRGLKVVPPCLTILGRVSHQEALALIRDADFSVLLRTPLRYAQAGFPTKVVESMALGTPVICNLTSDLGEYIQDGQEGIVCEGHLPDNLVVALERALAMSIVERQAMRVAARCRAEQAFDYRRYRGAFEHFFERIGVTGK